MGADSSVATVALIVSLIALFIALLQLLQQIFGTAEGYRRCQESIIGPWSKLRGRKIRWSELRIETVFCVPDFSFEYGNEVVLRSVKDGAPHAFDNPRAQPLIPLRADLQRSHVSWLGLMSSLADLAQNHDSYARLIPEAGEKRNWKSMRCHPVFMPEPQSWDLIPPDVVRPLATARLGDLLVLGHRLGMDWTLLEPDESRLFAEGNGQNFVSLEIRSLGLALRYTNRDPQLVRREDFFHISKQRIEGSRLISRLFVPTVNADMMAFGFIPADPVLGTEQCCVEGGSWPEGGSKPF